MGEGEMSVVTTDGGSCAGLWHGPSCEFMLVTV